MQFLPGRPLFTPNSLPGPLDLSAGTKPARPGPARPGPARPASHMSGTSPGTLPAQPTLLHGAPRADSDAISLSARAHLLTRIPTPSQLGHSG